MGSEINFRWRWWWTGIGVGAVLGMGFLYFSITRWQPETESPRWKPEQEKKRYAVEIHKPDRVLSVRSGKIDASGTRGRVACSVCHEKVPPPTSLRSIGDLKDFHQKMEYNHGHLNCASCHDAGSHYAGFKLADGSTVPYRDVMQLCAQCHGPQFRDYQNGSHGGMAGYWDLNRGPRRRNNCIDCHDAHAPRYRRVMPVFSPDTNLTSNNSKKEKEAH